MSVTYIRGVPEALLAELQAAGASLDLTETGALLIRAPRGALTDAMKAGIRHFKAEFQALAEWREALLAEDRARAAAYHGTGREATGLVDG